MCGHNIIYEMMLSTEITVHHMINSFYYTVEGHIVYIVHTSVTFTVSICQVERISDALTLSI